MKKILSFLVLAGLVFVVAGCNKADNQPAASPAPPQEEVAAVPDIIPEAKSGVPRNYPDDAPYYDNYESVRGEENDMLMTEEDASLFTLVIDTKDSAQEIFSFYQDEYAQRNWKALAEIITGDDASYIASKDGACLMVTVEAGEDGRVISHLLQTGGPSLCAMYDIGI